ncbi:MAG: hypothetical protein QXP58_08480 [Thermoprotei archaeon]
MNFEVKHLDTNIIMAAFFPSPSDINNDMHTNCLDFLNHIKSSEPNTKLRVSFTALGELLYKNLKRNTQEFKDGYEKLKEYIESIGNKRFEVYSPKLKGIPEKLGEVIEKIKATAGDQIVNSHADVLILTYAIVDGEASALYTTDGMLLSSIPIKNVVEEFRRNNCMRKLSIKPINNHSN